MLAYDRGGSIFIFLQLSFFCHFKWYTKCLYGRNNQQWFMIIVWNLWFCNLTIFFCKNAQHPKYVLKWFEKGWNLWKSITYILFINYQRIKRKDTDRIQIHIPCRDECQLQDQLANARLTFYFFISNLSISNTPLRLQRMRKNWKIPIYFVILFCKSLRIPYLVGHLKIPIMISGLALPVFIIC